MRKSSPELLAALEREMQLMSGGSVLLSQCVAALAGINATDLECLGAIDLAGGASAGELAAATGLSTGAITGVIDRLELAGYVRREHDPADRRRVMVKPQPRAAEIARFYEPLARGIHALWSEYDDAQLALIIDFMARSRKVAERHLGDLQALAEAGTASRAAARGKRR